LLYSPTLKVEVTCSSERKVKFISDDGTLPDYGCENVKTITMGNSLQVESTSLFFENNNELSS
jgi:hypothetical protein